ncbi:MAG TPA: RagB/SusD family nutrient uptake outer membrane protein [Paludibacter sp.]|nr:RagB/SusD family nutrient uptake outer membrane protein [Paludibacter sp.]
MKRYIFLLIIAAFLITINSCRNVLDLKPLDKISSETMLANEDGVRVFLGNLYYQAPFEDFTYNRVGFHTGSVNTVGIHPDAQTGNAVNSEYNHLVDGTNFGWWDAGYKFNRDVNLLLKTIPTISTLKDDLKNELLSEAHFLRAFGYYALAKRYGGVPIISEYQEYTSEVDSLKVPRSTEKDTWDFVMMECDQAVKYLPSTRSGSNARRATKWAAYALKSRAALHAASIAKYGNKVPFSGDAVSQGLVGLDVSQANHYYELCIEASKAIMTDGIHGLYMANPNSVDEARNNLLALFQDPNVAPEEAILVYGYGKPGTGHSMDFWFNPNQTADGSPHPGRMNPTLDLVDTYENYTAPGESAPIITTADGKIGDYNGFDSNKNYLHFDTPYDIFKDKDARLWSTVILPGTEWKGQTIRIQAGYVKPDGTAVIEADRASIVVEGVTYHTFGADAWKEYSGFDQQHLAETTRTGFSFKKFLSPITVPGNNALGFSTQDWMEFRYAEVLLNYAEAVVESGYTDNGAEQIAIDALNATRHRAGHVTNIQLSIENVQRERRVELSFENKRWWDLIRRREFHEEFNNKIQTSLCPVLDLRVSPPKYIFIRKYIIREVPLSFPTYMYYSPIPGIGSNGLIQNPNY